MQAQNRLLENGNVPIKRPFDVEELSPGNPIELSSSSNTSTTKKIRQTSDQLKDLVAGSERILLDMKSVFPFDFFPDELIADESKVSIHTNYFFVSKEARSIQYTDIFNVIVSHGLFFANIEIVDRYYAQQPIVVKYLKKDDAILARRIIQGMIIAKKEEIDIGNLPKELLLKRLEEIGKSR